MFRYSKTKPLISQLKKSQTPNQPLANHAGEEIAEEQILRLRERIKSLNELEELNKTLRDPNISMQITKERKNVQDLIKIMQEQFGINVVDTWAKLGGDIMRGQLLFYKDQNDLRISEGRDTDYLDLVDENDVLLARFKQNQLNQLENVKKIDDLRQRFRNTRFKYTPKDLAQQSDLKSSKQLRQYQEKDQIDYRQQLGEQADYYDEREEKQKKKKAAADKIVELLLKRQQKQQNFDQQTGLQKFAENNLDQIQQEQQEQQKQQELQQQNKEKAKKRREKKIQKELENIANNEVLNANQAANKIIEEVRAYRTSINMGQPIVSDEDWREQMSFKDKKLQEILAKKMKRDNKQVSQEAIDNFKENFSKKLKDEIEKAAGIPLPEEEPEGKKVEEPKPEEQKIQPPSPPLSEQETQAETKAQAFEQKFQNELKNDVQQLLQDPNMATNPKLKEYIKEFIDYKKSLDGSGRKKPSQIDKEIKADTKKIFVKLGFMKDKKKDDGKDVRATFGQKSMQKAAEFLKQQQI